MFYFLKKAVEHLVNKKKKENTLKNELIKMKSCRTLNRQTVVDCDPPPPPNRPLPIWPKSSADLEWGG